jgi:hypothetical protein
MPRAAVFVAAPGTGHGRRCDRLEGQARRRGGGARLEAAVFVSVEAVVRRRQVGQQLRRCGSGFCRDLGLGRLAGAMSSSCSAASFSVSTCGTGTLPAGSAQAHGGGASGAFSGLPARREAGPASGGASGCCAKTGSGITRRVGTLATSSCAARSRAAAPRPKIRMDMDRDDRGEQETDSGSMGSGSA